MDISIIIPTFNPSEQFLAHRLHSLDSQTFDRKRFEVLVIQNGPHGDNEILNQLNDLFPQMNIRIIKTTEKGVSNARNIGIENAQGQYLCFIDDDDWVSADYLEKLYSCAAEGTIAEAFVVGKESTDSADRRDYLGDIYQRLADVPNVGIMEGRRFLASACCKIIPRKLIGDTRFDKRFSMGEDALFMATLSKDIRILRAASGYPTYFRRLTPHSASRTSKSLTQRIKNLIRLWKAYTGVYFSAPLKYSLPFFSNRLIATCKWLFK